MVVKKLNRPVVAIPPDGPVSVCRGPADGLVDSLHAGLPAAADREPRAEVYDVSFVMPTTSFVGPFVPCARRILEIIESTGIVAEFVVALDGREPVVPDWLDRPNVTIVMTGSRSGPAVARNAAALEARGRIIFFVDADVQLEDGAVDRVMHAFREDPDLAAVFGAYDDEPAVVGVISQFRNLLHHHTHVLHSGPVITFWSGCGAVRAAFFLDVGGFDDTIAIPSVEDIDIGMRITDAGGRIAIDPALRCKHLKRWTLGSMIMTDVFQRAVPWTKLILSSRRLPATLSIDWTARICGVAALVGLAAVVASWAVPTAGWVALGAAGVVLLLNRGFYGLCLRKHGLLFAIAAVGLHYLYFCYASIAFGIVALSRLPWAVRFDRASAAPAMMPATAMAAAAMPPVRRSSLRGMQPQH